MLHDYSISWVLHCDCRFDDLDFVSRLQVSQKYKLQIVRVTFLFRFLSTVILNVVLLLHTLKRPCTV